MQSKWLLLSSLLVSAAGCADPVETSTEQDLQGPELVVSDAIHFDHSGPTTGLSPTATVDDGKKEKERDKKDLPGTDSAEPDTAAQKQPGTGAPSAGVGFDAIGQDFVGPANPGAPYDVIWSPSDNNISVGPTEIVEVTNDQIAAFNKSGAPTWGPYGVNALWSGFGGNCEINNDGDPVVKFDTLAQRWVVTQFNVSTLPYSQCVAVSSSSSFTGSTWNRYEFTYSGFNDYGKLAVWNNAYYMTYNMFGGGSFKGAMACALERDKMLAGQAAREVCFQMPKTVGGLLAADVDGTTAPTGDELVMNFSAAKKGAATLNEWAFHPDWTNTANSTITAKAAISVAGFSSASPVAQPGTSQTLDVLGDRFMFRLAARTLAAPTSCAAAGRTVATRLVVNHTVSVGGVASVRWYDLGLENGSAFLCQQGTYNPDSTNRWMASAAMDKLGNIGVGYSVSSTTEHPGIRYTGRLAGDAAGTMGAETNIQTGGGSQQGINRWGDYSSLVLDPTDDCTFWYVNQYLKVDGRANWTTHVASFKFSSCH